jgi:hypothetical protein
MSDIGMPYEGKEMGGRLDFSKIAKDRILDEVQMEELKKVMDSIKKYNLATVVLEFLGGK